MARKQVDFQVNCSNSLEGLETTVKKFMKDGWELGGNFVVNKNTSGVGVVYYQPMVKYEEVEEKKE